MANATWTDGYTSEINYTGGYYSTQSPRVINMAMLSRGYKPIDLTHYKYLELGYGLGLSVNIHAAASNNEFWGTDFNPNHAAIATRLAKSSGADLKLFDDSFEDLVKRTDMPEFDLITMHGVWSWISEKNQNAIVDLLKRKLKVGGALMISYNCYPGWAAMVPLQHLLNLHKNTTADKSQDPRVSLQSAFKFIDALADADANFFQANPQVKGLLDDLRQQDQTYLVHELFHDTWPVTPFAKVADKLSEAKMSYVGPANLLEHIDVFVSKPQHQKIINSIGDLTLRETVRDFCKNTRFRSDIFTKGAQPLTREDRDEELRRMVFALVRHPENLDYEKIEISENQYVGLRKAYMEPVVKALAENDFAPKSVAEIEKHKDVKDLNFDQLAEILLTLSSCSVISPAQPDDVSAAAEESCRALNVELVNQVKRNNLPSAIASPALGGGFGVKNIQLIFLDAMNNKIEAKKDMISHSWEFMKKVGWKFMDNGRQIDDEKESLRRVEDELDFFFKERLPLMKAQKIV